MIVVFYHAILTIPGSFEDRLALRVHGFDEKFAWLYLTPLRLFVSGPAAVYLFFVLSGFVLTLSLGAGGRETYSTFMLKRIVRIWLPFAIAVLISAILAEFFSPIALSGTSAWMYQTWSGTVSLPMVLRHLAMLGTDITLDNPMWSLIHEMRVSFIFPFLVFAAVKRPAFLSIGVSATFALSIVLQTNHNLSPFTLSYVTTLCYLPLFLFGIMLALHRTVIFRFFEDLSPRFRIILWVLALAGLSYSPVVTSTVERLNDSILLLINGFAATAIVSLAVTGNKIRHFLEKRVLLWLGKISYSLYLLHVVVFAVLLRFFAGMPLPMLLPPVIGVALIVAAVFQRFVEQPAAVVGRVIASRLSRPSYAQSKATIAGANLAND